MDRKVSFQVQALSEEEHSLRIDSPALIPCNFGQSVVEATRRLSTALSQVGEVNKAAHCAQLG